MILCGYEVLHLWIELRDEYIMYNKRGYAMKENEKKVLIKEI